MLNRIFCFAAGTQVVVGINADGSFITRNIEDLKPGDLVLSRDEFEASGGGRVEFKPIVATSEKTSDHLRIVTLIDDAGNISTIRTTDEHPFYVMGIGWTSAKELEGGQQFATADSTRTLTVLSNIREERATGVKVYNFTVADNHTYFVTDAPTRGPPAAAWAHNKCAGFHHFFTRAFGSIREKGLYYLSKAQHTLIHNELSAFLKKTTGFAYNALSGKQWQKKLTLEKRIALLRQFHRELDATDAGKKLAAQIVKRNKLKPGTTLSQMLEAQLKLERLL